MARKYTDAEIQTVKEMREANKTRADIGRFLGVGVKAVDSLIEKHGLTKVKEVSLTPEQEAQFRKMWLDDVPINQIKTVLHLSFYGVTRLVERFKLPLRTRQINVTAEQAGHDRRNGRTTSEPIPAFHPAMWAMLWPNGQPEWAARPAT